MSRFAFAFYATQWRPDLTGPLRACLHSIDTRGGKAAEYPRYLVYAEQITPEIQAFCERHRMIPQHEPRFTYRLSYPNKATMLRIPQYDAVCLTDLDIVFLSDPTPMFEQVASTGKVHTRYDLIVPLWDWPKLPKEWALYLRWKVAPKVWRAQYRRIARPGTPPVEEMPWSGGGTMPAYFNDGVAFVPGVSMQRLHDAWKDLALLWLRDVAMKRPYTFLFTNHFASQISYSFALYRDQIPWAALPVTHNYIPSETLPPQDRALIANDEIVMAHMVSGVRAWLTPGADPDCPDWMLPLYRRVQEVVAEIPRD